MINPDLPKLKKYIKNIYMTKENPNKQNVFDRVFDFFMIKKQNNHLIRTHLIQKPLLI